MVERIEREEDHVGRGGLLDLLREGVVDGVRRHEGALRRRRRRRAQRHCHGDEQPAPFFVEPRAVRRLPRQCVRDQRATRKIDVELVRVVGAGHQDAALVRDEHPRRTQQLAVLLGLVDRVAPRRRLEQAFAELRDLRAHRARSGERRGPSREKGLDPPPYAGQGAADRLVRGAVRLQRGEPQGDAQHAHDGQGGGDEDPGPEAEARRPSSARVRHSWGSRGRTCSCGASSETRARRAPTRAPRHHRSRRSSRA